MTKTLKNEREGKERLKSILLYAYTLILFVMNFIRIFDNSFWEDEGFTIRLAKMNIPDMISATAADVHPPLYYLFTQALYHIFGNHGFTYHLSAIIPYVIILLLACTVIKKNFGRIPAVVLVTMSSLMKSAIQYNVEARMYSLGAAFVLIAFLAFYKIQTTDKVRDWLVFCVASLGAAYTHYYALISVAFLYLMLIIVVIRRKKDLKRLILTYIITIAAYLPWLLVLVKSFQRTADDWWLGEIPGIKDCGLFLFDYKWLCLVFVCCVIIFALYQLKILNITKRRTDRLSLTVDINAKKPEKLCVSDELLWVISGLVAFGGTIVVGLGLSYAVRPFFLLRYLFPVSAMIYLIFGICISKLNFRRIVVAILVLLILWSNIPQYVEQYKCDKDIEQQTEAFLENVTPSEKSAIFTNCSPLDWTLLEYYYPQSAHAYREVLPENFDSSYEEIWLFWSDELDSTMLEQLKTQGYSVTEVYEGGVANGIFLHTYKLVKK